MPGALKVKDTTTGLWVYAGVPGPAGPTGPSGPMGVSSVIVGDFGSITTPADLPPDGLLPVDWDGPGNPAVAYQVEPGQSLYYDQPGDPTLDGHLFQFVTTAVNAAGWLDIGLIQGPQGPAGIDGPTGPTGPASDDIWVGPDAPPLPITELWYDTDDPRTLGPMFLPDGGLTHDVLSKTTDLDGDFSWQDIYSVPSGKIISFPNEADKAKIHLYSTTFGFGITGSTLNIFSSANIKFNQNSITGTELANIHTTGMTLWSGHFYLPTDGDGIRFNGDGYIYKKVGSGIKIRKSANNPMIQIENHDGGGGKDIVVVGGGQSLGQHVNMELSSHLVINGSNGSNSAHYYVNCDSNNNGYYFNVLEARRLNNTNVFTLKGYISDAAGDAHAKMYVNLGSEGIDEVTQWADYGDGQVCILCHGPMSATHFQDRNRSEMVAGTMAPIDPEMTGRLIDAVRPVTFARNFRSSTATDSNPEGFVRPHHDPIPTLGFDIIDAATPLADRLLGPEEGGYSVGGMLAVAVAEIKSLRARVAELEARCP